MNLRKRAISGIMLAGSMVVMCAIADAASTVSAEAVAVVADTRTDLATDGTAGVVAQLNQINTDIVEMAAAEGACCVAAYDALSGLRSLEEMKERIRKGWSKREYRP